MGRFRTEGWTYFDQLQEIMPNSSVRGSHVFSPMNAAWGWGGCCSSGDYWPCRHHTRAPNGCSLSTDSAPVWAITSELHPDLTHTFGQKSAQIPPDSRISPKSQKFPRTRKYPFWVIFGSQRFSSIPIASLGLFGGVVSLKTTNLGILIGVNTESCSVL
jgi:hypothetical protein